MITTIRKLLVTLVLVMSMLSGVVWAGGSVHVGDSTPAWIRFHQPRTWSYFPVKWDLTRWSSRIIPDRAVVDGIRLEWTGFPRYGWSGMQIILIDQRGRPILLSPPFGQEVETNFFDGWRVKQVWSAYFKVNRWWLGRGGRLDIAPKMTIHWRMP